MTFPQSCRGNPDESRLFSQLGRRSAAYIAHARLETAEQLMNAGRQRPPVGHPSFNTFRDQFQVAFHVILIITVFAAHLHGLQRSHPAIYLVRSPLIEDGFPGTLFRSRKKPADHDRMGAGC